MAIDSSIYARFSQPVKSVAEYDAERAQAEQNRLALALQRQKNDEYTRSLDDANKLRGVVSQFGSDRAANEMALVKAGRLSEAQAYAKQNADVGKINADAAESKAKADKLGLEAMGLASQQHKELLGPVNTRDGAVRWLTSAYKDERLAPLFSRLGTLDQQIEEIPNDPAGFQRWKEQSQIAADKLLEYTRANANTIATNKQSDINSQRTEASAAAGRAQAERHFNATQAGSKVPAGYRMNADGTMSAIPGGPADIKQGAEAAKKVSEAKDVLGLLDEVDTLLPKATSGYGGAALDTIAGAFGKSTEGAQTTAQLKAIEGALISKMPKMSGPQSDKDVLLYRQMAGQVGDATIPVAQRQAAAAMVRRLNEKYAGMPEGSSKKTPNAGAAFEDPEKERRYQEWKAKQGQ